MTVGFLGLAFAVVYVWKRSLVAPILMHVLKGFPTIIIRPLLYPWAAYRLRI